MTEAARATPDLTIGAQLGDQVLRVYKTIHHVWGRLLDEPASKLDLALGNGHRHALRIDFGALDKAVKAAQELVKTYGEDFIVFFECDEWRAKDILREILTTAEWTKTLRVPHERARKEGLNAD